MTGGRTAMLLGLAGAAAVAGAYLFIVAPSFALNDFEIREGEIVPDGIEAPFSFEVLLPADEISGLRQEVEATVPLYLSYSDDVWPEVREGLSYRLDELSVDSLVIQGALRELGIMYEKGVMDLDGLSGESGGGLAIVTRNGMDGTPAPLGNVNIHGLSEVEGAFASTLRGGGIPDEQADSLSASLAPNVLVDGARRQASIAEALASYSMVDTLISAGDMIVPAGGVVTEQSARYLEALRSSQAEGMSGRRARNAAGRLLLLAGIFSVAVVYVRDSMKPAWIDRERVMLLCTSWTAALFVTGILSVLSGRFYGGSYASLVTFGALHTSVFTNRRHGAVFSILFAVLTAVGHPHPFSSLMVATASGSLAAYTGWDLRKRNTIPLCMVYASLAGTAAFLTCRLLDIGVNTTPVWIGILETLLSPVAGVGAAYALLPLFEKFGVSTVRSIEEVKKRDHPLLLDLSRWAMGTWQHSQHVSDLASEASRAIGADHVLAEAGGLFHDVGKVMDPKHFIENLPPETPNPHDLLHPMESAARLRAHVSEGVRLARKFRVPGPVIDIITQHHGMTVMRAFYEKARREWEQGVEGASEPQEADFRYSGPKPATREAAIVMLADAVESATKNMSGEPPEVIEGMVREVIEERDVDGQLDDCQLTRGNLTVIFETFLQVLQGRFHERVKDYPHG
ncbi:MAG: HDIG domain-containing protein [Candidatus Fermentibacter sp.]|nr:HDIG domain-containing protein [Candidatus Fermentibacter sp.]